MSSGDHRDRTVNDQFRKFAVRMSERLGSHWAFAAAVLVVGLWLVTGPLFRFSDAWQLVINTATTVITFLMVFLIQTTQNRDAKAIHLKLDELIRSSRARNVFADLEDASEAELAAFKEEFRNLRERRLPPGPAAEEAHRRVHRPGSH
ncbi:MAG TPA: low affinity iron permease family protein [Polyangia bacterium]|nr:low affinity iron permease family protein [Polyangia bacterium]